MPGLADCSSPESKNEFYQKLYRLLRIMHATGVVVVPNQFYIQIVYLARKERNIGDPNSVHVGFHNKLFLSIKLLPLKAALANLPYSFAFTILDLHWPLRDWQPLARLNRMLSIYLVWIYGLRSCFGPSWFYWHLICGAKNMKATRPTMSLLNDNSQLHFHPEISAKSSSHQSA